MQSAHDHHRTHHDHDRTSDDHDRGDDNHHDRGADHHHHRGADHHHTEAPTTTTEAPTTTTTTVALVPTITLSYLPSSDPDFCQVVIDLTDFAPGQTFVVTLFHTSSFGVNPASPWIFPNVMTDATGAAELVPFTYYQGFPENASLSAESNGLSTGFVNISC